MRYHRSSDPWGRGSFRIPQFAVVGVSDTGDYDDSPAPTVKVMAELEAFRIVLRANRIRSRIEVTQSGNACMAKVWVVVRGADYERAKNLADSYLPEHDAETHWIHDAA